MLFVFLSVICAPSVGIAIKKEMIVDGQTVYEYATSIDENYIIKPGEFQLPANVVMQ